MLDTEELTKLYAKELKTLSTEFIAAVKQSSNISWVTKVESQKITQLCKIINNEGVSRTKRIQRAKL